MKSYDVIVVGGGISGSMAAIQAAREGAKTLLIEKNSFLGGMLTASGVGPMMTFHAGSKLAVRGIPNELIERLKKRGKSPGHIYDTTTYTYTVTPFDMEGMKHELEMMALEASVDILYNAILNEVSVVGDVLTKITVTTKEKELGFSAKVFIDATGDADLSYKAGVRTQLGRVTDNKTQPLTMNLKMANVNIEKIKNHIKANKENFREYKNDASPLDKAPRLSLGGFEREITNAIEDGRLSFLRERVLFFETNNPGEVIVNTSRVVNINPTDPYEMSKAEAIGRKQVRELEEFLRSDIPGFENSYVIYSGPSIGVRSSRQIIGTHVLHETELVGLKKFEDTICHGGYPIDVHPAEGHDKFVDWSKVHRHLNYGDMYSIPFRALTNLEVSNLITVGRCISATFEAQGGIRVSPIAAGIGQAGGAAASVMVIKSVFDSKKIDYKEIQDVLLKWDAYLEL